MRLPPRSAVVRSRWCGVEGDATGAFVAPLLSPDGCVGVLALEFANGGEQHELVQALATLVTAQFSTLFAATPQAAIEEEWVTAGPYPRRLLRNVPCTSFLRRTEEGQSWNQHSYGC